MGLRNAFDDLAIETTQQDIKNLQQQIAELNEQMKTLNDTMLFYLSAMLEKMPRVDAADRVVTNIETGSISTISTVSNIASLNTLGNLQRIPDGIPGHMSNAGAMHIYNGIEVS